MKLSVFPGNGEKDGRVNRNVLRQIYNSKDFYNDFF